MTYHMRVFCGAKEVLGHMEICKTPCRKLMTNLLEALGHLEYIGVSRLKRKEGCVGNYTCTRFPRLLRESGTYKLIGRV